MTTQALFNILLFRELLPSATKLRRLCFYTCLSFCSQGGVPQSMLEYHTPREAHLPGSTPPPRESHPRPREAHPPRKHTTPGKQTPQEAHTFPGKLPPPGKHTPLLPGDGCRCGRHASYWNAFLYNNLFSLGLYHVLSTISFLPKTVCQTVYSTVPVYAISLIEIISVKNGNAMKQWQVNKLTFKNPVVSE